MPCPHCGSTRCNQWEGTPLFACLDCPWLYDPKEPPMPQLRCPKCGSTSYMSHERNGGHPYFCGDCRDWTVEDQIAWLRSSHAELLAALKNLTVSMGEGDHRGRAMDLVSDRVWAKAMSAIARADSA